jgi:hypothetical protein
MTSRAIHGIALGLAAALVLLGQGCAKRADWVEGTLVTVDVTGAWKGRMFFVPGGLGEFEMTLKQRGAKVTGDGRLRAQKLAIEGTVRGDVFSFTDPGGRLRAEAAVNGDEMSGEGRMAGQQTAFRFTLSR